MTLFPLRRHPALRDPDLDSGNTPPSARDMRQAIMETDGLIVISPNIITACREC